MGFAAAGEIGLDLGVGAAEVGADVGLGAAEAGAGLAEGAIEAGAAGAADVGAAGAAAAEGGAALGGDALAAADFSALGPGGAASAQGADIGALGAVEGPSAAPAVGGAASSAVPATGGVVSPTGALEAGSNDVLANAGGDLLDQGALPANSAPTSGGPIDASQPNGGDMSGISTSYNTLMNGEGNVALQNVLDSSGAQIDAGNFAGYPPTASAGGDVSAALAPASATPDASALAPGAASTTTPAPAAATAATPAAAPAAAAPAAAAPAATPAAAAAAPAASGGLLSSSNLKLAGLAAGAAPLALLLAKGESPLPPQAQQLTATNTSLQNLANTDLNLVANNQLTSGQAAQIATMQQNLTSQWKQVLFNQGVQDPTKDTRWPQIQAQIAQQVNTATQSMINTTLQAALGASGQASSNLLAVANLQVQQDTAFTTAIGNATKALGTVAALSAVSGKA
jgi:hypothetical protein